MADPSQELDWRLVKMSLSSIMKTLEVLHPDIDVHQTVRQHMLGICAGVRERVLDAAGDKVAPEQATANVDALIKVIDDYFDYSANPMFGTVELVRRDG
ncbi:MAG: hypothetical protein ACR2QB_08820 [Gammaproteobacteria bacterium]